jgi:hypothetical protein
VFLCFGLFGIFLCFGFFFPKLKCFVSKKKIHTKNKMENKEPLQTELDSGSSESSVESSESSVQSDPPVQSEAPVEQPLAVFQRNQGMKNDLCNVSPISMDINKIQITILYMAGPFLVVEPKEEDKFDIQTRGSSGPSVCTQIAMKVIQRLDMKKEPPVLLETVKRQFRMLLEEGELEDEEGDSKTTDGLLSYYTKFPKLVLFRQGVVKQDGMIDKKQSRLVVVIRVHGSRLKDKTIQSVVLPPKEGDGKDLFLREAMIAAALEIARLDFVALETSDVARNARVARDKENRGRLGRASVSLKNPSRNAKRIAKLGAGAVGLAAAGYLGHKQGEKIGGKLVSGKEYLRKTSLAEKLLGKK